MAKKQSGKEITLSSGVTVTILPFPLGLLERINRDNPDPVPPKKTITVLGGTEEVDDEKNPEYIAEKSQVAARRNTKLGEATIEFCVDCDMAKHEREIKRLEKITSAFPDDPDERRSRFLTEYALRTVNDYSLVIMAAINQSTLTDTEVSERIATFQSDLSQRAVNGTQTPGTHEVERLDVVEPTA